MEQHPRTPQSPQTGSGSAGHERSRWRSLGDVGGLLLRQSRGPTTATPPEPRLLRNGRPSAAEQAPGSSGSGSSSSSGGGSRGGSSRGGGGSHSLGGSRQSLGSGSQRRSLHQPQPLSGNGGGIRDRQSALAAGRMPPGSNRSHRSELSGQSSSSSSRPDEARLRELAELQRQLEGLQQATASLQAAVSHVERSGASAAASRAERASGHRQSPASARRTATEEAMEVAEDDEDEEDEEATIHPHVTCDGCGAGPPLVGRVMKCLDCEDFDFCAQCFSNRDRTGHPRGHRFRARAGREAPGASPQLLLRILESTMLSEALRRSTEGEGNDQAEADQNVAEVRAAEVLSSLPRLRWEASGKGDTECALCLEEYSQGEEVLKLPCGHLFHENCVGPWFAKSLLCPLCQQEASV